MKDIAKTHFFLTFGPLPSKLHRYSNEIQLFQKVNLRLIRCKTTNSDLHSFVYIFQWNQKFAKIRLIFQRQNPFEHRMYNSSALFKRFFIASWPPKFFTMAPRKKITSISGAELKIRSTLYQSAKVGRRLDWPNVTLGINRATSLVALMLVPATGKPISRPQPPHLHIY